METFSVELHSSASFKLYPQNTIASFTNFLTDQINLEGEWEVAQTEICFPSKFSISRKEVLELMSQKDGKL